MIRQTRVPHKLPEFVAPIIVMALISCTACVEQSREKKKYGRTFESSSTGAYMPFQFAPVPEGRWVNTSSDWKMNTAPDMDGLKPGR